MKAPKCRTCGEYHLERVCDGGTAQVKFTPQEVKEAFAGLVDLPPPKKTAARPPKEHRLVTAAKEALAIARMPRAEVVKATKDAAEMAREIGVKFDRVAYQREYMRKWRARQKEQK